MRVYFHPDAEAEFDKAVEYYEELQRGLGIEFAEPVLNSSPEKRLMPYGLKKPKTELTRSIVVRWRRFQQEMYSEKLKRKEVDENRIPSSSKS